jgi:methionyl-tRNA formyltransferase
MFKLNEGVDTGEIIGQEVTKLDEKITATELYQKVNDMHVTLISKYWDDIVNNNIKLIKQNEAEATVWPGRKPEDGEIFNSMTMEEADRLVRAVTRPYPGAFYRDGDRIIRIWSAKTDENEGLIKLSDGYLIPINYEIEG